MSNNNGRKWTMALVGTLVGAMGWMVGEMRTTRATVMTFVDNYGPRIVALERDSYALTKRVDFITPLAHESHKDVQIIKTKVGRIELDVTWLRNRMEDK